VIPKEEHTLSFNGFIIDSIGSIIGENDSIIMDTDINNFIDREVE